MKKVYACFCTDIIHEGHLNIIHQAAKYGEVIVGVLCDSERIKYNRFPTNSIEERISLFEEISEVSRVVVQNSIMYDDIVAELEPDYIIHGDNWHDGPESVIRQNVVESLRKIQQNKE